MHPHDDHGDEALYGTLLADVERIRGVRRRRFWKLAKTGAAITTATFGLAAGLALRVNGAAVDGHALAFGLVAAPTPVPAADAPLIQVALLLDTSSSMEGLIDQARSQMWKVVNQLAEARRQGQRPKVELALFEYGHDALREEANYVRQVLAFTTDFDRVSEQLFALTINGGYEYCGAVIQNATRRLDWSARTNDVRLVLIAGNESFTQGPVAPADAIGEAKARGIVVNTILCKPAAPVAWRDGNEGDVASGWRKGAEVAGGQFVVIDHDAKVPHIVAPQDGEIARLGNQLNATYLPYGAGGAESLARQTAQDANASAIHQGADLERSLCKAGASYRNDAWDLVDAVTSHTVDLAKLADADLPPALRGLDASGRADLVARKAKERADLKAAIERLFGQRAAFVTAERDKLNLHDAPSTLDVALLRVARTEAERKGFTFGGGM